jgi:hypothetical protein
MFIQEVAAVNTWFVEEVDDLFDSFSGGTCVVHSAITVPI